MVKPRKLNLKNPKNVLEYLMAKRANAISEVRLGDNSPMNRASALTDLAAKDSITLDLANIPTIT